MSRPAVRSIPERIVPCPTCGAKEFRPCNAHTEAEIERAMGTNVWKVPPHTARRKAEKAERERRASIIDTPEKAQALPGVGAHPTYREEPPPMTTTTVLTEVSAERSRQIAKGYTTQHDDEHGAAGLVAWAQHYASVGARQGNRSDLIKAAALLVAAAETVDRLGSFDGARAHETPGGAA